MAIDMLERPLEIGQPVFAVVGHSETYTSKLFPVVGVVESFTNKTVTIKILFVRDKRFVKTYPPGSFKRCKWERVFGINLTDEELSRVDDLAMIVKLRN